MCGVLTRRVELAVKGGRTTAVVVVVSRHTVPPVREERILNFTGLEFYGAHSINTRLLSRYRKNKYLILFSLTLSLSLSVLRRTVTSAIHPYPTLYREREGGELRDISVTQLALGGERDLKRLEARQCSAAVVPGQLAVAKFKWNYEREGRGFVVIHGVFSDAIRDACGYI